MPGTTTNRSLPFPTGSDSLTAFPALMQNAMTILDTHTHTEYAVAGSAGIPFRMATGTVDITGNGTAARTANASMPSSRFTVAPFIFLQVHNQPGYYAYSDTGATASTVPVILRRFDGATFSSAVTVTVRWIAIQMASGAAAG